MFVFFACGTYRTTLVFFMVQRPLVSRQGTCSRSAYNNVSALSPPPVLSHSHWSGVPSWEAAAAAAGQTIPGTGNVFSMRKCEFVSTCTEECFSIPGFVSFSEGVWAICTVVPTTGSS